MTDQVQDTTMKTQIGTANPGHNPILKGITAPVITIPTKATQGHNTGIDTATIRAVHDDHAPPVEATAIGPTGTHHIADHPHIEVLQLTNPEIK